jgi:hypothetical protein
MMMVGRRRCRSSHKLEEDICLFGLEVEVAHLVNGQDFDSRKVIDQLSGGAVSQ